MISTKIANFGDMTMALSDFLDDIQKSSSINNSMASKSSN